MRYVDLSGKEFGRWRVISKFGSTKNGTATWLCICSCGTERAIKSSRLMAGESKSCGCLSKEIAKAQETTHGMSKTSMYSLWASMKARCQNKKSANYYMYGGRGITVCERWQSFDNFFSDMNPRPEGTTLDRIDNNKGYSPENCRWATPLEQGANKRNNNKYEVQGVIYNLSEIKRKFSIPHSTFTGRLSRGWSVEKAALTPINDKHQRKF